MNGYGRTDVGRKRSVNQDTFSAFKMKNGCFIAVVCDGMGGAAGGSIASSIAKDIFLTELEKLLDAYMNAPSTEGAPGVAIPRILRKAVSLCNAFTHELSQRDPGLRGMGTTLVAALIYDNVLYACNVGDSRLYLLSKDGVVQITKDHSYVQALVDSGKLTASEARTNDRKNIITKAIGIEEDVEADSFAVPLEEEKEQYFLLCSDGLSNLLEERDLYKIVLQPKELLSIEKKVDCLIELANERGGNDNITAYLIDSKG
jgi:protein phosphatase